MSGNNVFLPQVTRIPVTGSDQYNTLVCISAADYIRAGDIGEVGKMQRSSQSIITPFKLFGLLDQNPAIAPVFDHSTTAWISQIGPTNAGDWTIAVDSVTGAGFSPQDGSFYVNIDTAGIPCMVPTGQCVPLLGVCFWVTIVQISSYVLCYEPPKEAHSHHPRDTRRFEKFAPHAPIIQQGQPRTSLEILLRGLRGGAVPGGAFGMPVSTISSHVDGTLPRCSCEA